MTIIRRVLMGEWAKNDSRLTALKALSNLEQQFQSLEEQHAALRRTLEQIAGNHGRCDAGHVRIAREALGD